LDKKYILVTGSSSGIGLATVQELQACGYSVIAAARTDKALSLLSAMGATSVYLDLNDPASIAACVDEISALTPKLHGLINNAGYAQPGAVQELSLAAMQAQFQTNVFGSVDLTNKCLPLLLHGQPAYLIFLSSILGVVSAPCLGAYCASKFALEAFVSSLRMELSSENIRVTSIRPGAIETQFRERAVQELKGNIAVDKSQYRKRYQRSIKNLHNEAVKSKRASAEVVAKLIASILHKRKPKAAYYITAAAKSMGALRHFIPQRWAEWIMMRHR
jgi:NAD(P)-dependent dehydrogenase (short-subunit alcohol dehydrogenase family)